MSRVLFVVPPLAGHVNPAVALAGELASRGHTVAIAGHAAAVGSLLPAGLPLFALDGSLDEAWRAELDAKSRSMRGTASLKFLWEEFLVPLGASMVPAVSAVVEEFSPDALVVDQQALGAALVARRRGLPWATLATTSAEFDDPYRVLAGVGQWVTERLRDFQVSQGLSAAEAAAGDLRFSEHLTLVCSGPAAAAARRLPRPLCVRRLHGRVAPARPGLPVGSPRPWAAHGARLARNRDPGSGRALPGRRARGAVVDERRHVSRGRTRRTAADG
jgi:hypothetical protein